ncbi:MAG TPA: prenyltransferase/squalene oxidase repeat-containing protein [Tepidisphaeraceae bacterium]|jgi:hypothetical protein
MTSSHSRRSLWLRVVILTLLLSLTLLCSFTSAADAPATDGLNEELDRRIDNGLAFLAKSQNPDGSFDGVAAPKCAATGLSLMSFLAAGHVPDAGKYRDNVRAAIDFLIKQAQPDGYFGRADGSRMYGQGIVTLALTEAYGVEDAERRQKLRPVLQSALKLIYQAQDVAKGEAFAGGWRYEPGAADSDMSLTGWNALALRAAQNAGFDVPKDRVKRAAQFVLKCYIPAQKGFAYQPGGGATPGITGIAVLSLYLLDSIEHPELAEAAKYLATNAVTEDTPMFHYSLYYATQAAFQAGEPTWPPLWVNARQRLSNLQMPDGGWPVSKVGQEPGRIYATAMALLTLEVPYRLLPIYQR